MQRRNASTDRKWPSRILLKERAKNIARDMLCTLGRKTQRASFFGKVNIGISGLFLFLCIVRLLASSGKLTLFPKLRFTCKFPCGRHQSENATLEKPPSKEQENALFCLFRRSKKVLPAKKQPHPIPSLIHSWPPPVAAV